MTGAERNIGVGLSSGSASTESALGLAEVTLSAGGAGVDLRIGKGHGWEREGISHGISTLTDLGLSVYFFGIGMYLGKPGIGFDSIPAMDRVPVKVFCVEEPDKHVVAEQCAAAARQGVELLVETHLGGPNIPRLIELAEQTGIGIVLDLLGLAAISDPDPGLLRGLAPHVRAGQVKGFVATDDGWLHRPLVSADLDPIRQILASGAPIRAITVESRAGTPSRDIALVHRLCLECSA
ncbi:hypothetical protein [Nocardia wallacei]|uniref:hypothetical protein n=1 Tax=Nocardia wallacei TaxID=480035 RepID=UPI002454E3A6|nr:hypothetical protein [Nocardia wallacei]